MRPSSVRLDALQRDFDLENPFIKNSSLSLMSYKSNYLCIIVVVFICLFIYSSFIYTAYYLLFNITWNVSIQAISFVLVIHLRHYVVFLFCMNLYHCLDTS